ncbi:MAG: TIGR02996 domain-containing protein [Gemmataceae bacterium]
MATAFDNAFLDDIHAHPGDDAPRLVYADWLDDHGDIDRAEFIRLQIELSRLAPGDAWRGQLAAREAQLLLAHEEAWRAQLPSLEGVTWQGFARGFVESAFVESPEAFERQAGAIFTAAPVVRLQVGDLDAASTSRLARSPHLARLTELNLGNNPAMGRGVRALADSPYVANLTSLLLHYNDLGAEVAAVADSPCLGRLTELYVSGNGLTDEVVVALGRSTTLPRLAELDLRDNQVGDNGARALAYHGLRDALTTLWLVNNQVGEGGAWALAGTPYLPRLSQLYLNYNPVGDEGGVAFASSPHRRALRDLDLRCCGIRDAGACRLAESPHLDGVGLLWLGGNRLKAETVALLRRRFGERLRM